MALAQVLLETVGRMAELCRGSHHLVSKEFDLGRIEFRGMFEVSNRNPDRRQLRGHHQNPNRLEPTIPPPHGSVELLLLLLWSSAVVPVRSFGG